MPFFFILFLIPIAITFWIRKNWGMGVLLHLPKTDIPSMPSVAGMLQRIEDLKDVKVIWNKQVGMTRRGELELPEAWKTKSSPALLATALHQAAIVCLSKQYPKPVSQRENLVLQGKIVPALTIILCIFAFFVRKIDLAKGMLCLLGVLCAYAVFGIMTQRVDREAAKQVQKWLDAIDFWHPEGGPLADLAKATKAQAWRRLLPWPM